MKHLITLLALLIGINSFAQDTPPPGTKQVTTNQAFIAPDSTGFDRVAAPGVAAFYKKRVERKELDDSVRVKASKREIRLLKSDTASSGIYIISNPTRNYIQYPHEDFLITTSSLQPDSIFDMGSLRGSIGGYDNKMWGGLANGMAFTHHSRIRSGTTHGSIWGGSLHEMLGGNYSFIGGGSQDTTQFDYAAIIASLSSRVKGTQSAIISSQNGILGASNSFMAASQNSYATQGRNIMLATNNGKIPLGTYNFMAPSLNSEINTSAGGRSYILTGSNLKNFGSYSGVGAGQNIYNGSNYSYAAGLSNTIWNGGTYNQILLGTLNYNTSVGYGTVVNGQSQRMRNLYGLMGGGKLNEIDTLSDKATILNGESGYAKSDYALILQGLRGKALAPWSTVVNGVDQTNQGVYNFHAGGTGNSSNNTGYALMGPGKNMTIKAIRSTSLNGENQLIDSLANESTILGGVSVTTKGEKSIAGGSNITAFSFAEVSLGAYSTNYTATSITGVSADDRAIVYGAGNSSTRFNAFTLMKSGRLSLAGASSDNPTAYLHLPAGGLGAGLGAIKFTNSTLMGTPEIGAIEFSGDRLYFTQTTGSTRQQLAYVSDLSSIASANTLTTTRTIWGQNFNGSANVSGAITGATTGTFSGSVSATSFGNATATNALISTASTGTTIASNKANADDVLKVNNSNASSTGRNLVIQNAGVETASISKTGAITALSYTKTGGTSTEYLMADGSVSSMTIASGTYTPTITNGTNITSSTAHKCHWTRVGNEVTVRGQINVTSPGISSTDLLISLPIGQSSNFATVYDLTGNGSIFMGSEHFLSINADTTADLPKLLWSGTAGTSEAWFSFTYTIIP